MLSQRRHIEQSESFNKDDSPFALAKDSLE